MTTMSAVMDGLAALVSTSNAYSWPVESITVPAFVVGYPTIDFDLAMAGGADTWVVPVWYVVGKSGTEAARDELSAGLVSVKAALDGLHSFGDVRVTRAEPTEITVAGVAYLAARFDCEVYG